MRCLAADQNANAGDDREDGQDQAHVYEGDRDEGQQAGEDEPNAEQKHAQIAGLNPFHDCRSYFFAARGGPLRMIDGRRAFNNRFVVTRPRCRAQPSLDMLCQQQEIGGQCRLGSALQIHG